MTLVQFELSEFLTIYIYDYVAKSKMPAEIYEVKKDRTISCHPGT
jgi:hypothetical protein